MCKGKKGGKRLETTNRTPLLFLETLVLIGNRSELQKLNKSKGVKTKTK